MVKTLKNNLINLFSPNKKLDKKVFMLVIAFQLAVAIFVWAFSSFPFLPKPDAVLVALNNLVMKENLIGELLTSTLLSLQGMFIAMIVSMIIAYLTVIPFFKPIGFIITKARFLTLVGLSFLFMLITHDGHSLKVLLLVFGVSVFFTTSMLDMISSIKREEFIHARTLRMNEWQVLWEVIILSRIDQVFEILRQNFAISWMMLTMVEGLSRADGGIGALLLNENKHFHLDAVFAIQLVILFVGIGQDYLFGMLKDICCPYSKLTLEKK